MHTESKDDVQEIFQVSQKVMKPPSARVRLQILTAGQVSACKFWLSFYRPGHEPADVACGNKTIEERLILGSHLGFREEQPLMLTEQESGNQVYLLYLPQAVAQDFSKELPKVLRLIEGWATQSIGLYACGQLFQGSSYLRVLEQLTQGILRNDRINDIYYFASKHQYLEILQLLTTLTMKLGLSDCEIFH